MLLKPLRLEFNWSEIPQRRMDTFVHIDFIEKAPELMVSIMVVKILGQVNFLLSDRPDEAFCVPVLPGLTLIGHTDLNLGVLKDLSLVRSRVLDTLVRLTDLWCRMLGQRSLQGCRCQAVIQIASQMPSTNTTSEDIHNHRQVNKPWRRRM
jgi:hypothetical protein